MERLVDALFTSDGIGRLIGNAPKLHVLRTPTFAICHVHRDVPPDIASRLHSLAQAPRGRPRHWSQEYAEYLNLLSTVAPLTSVRAGPLYSFPDRLEVSHTEVSHAVVALDRTNSYLLQKGLDEWLPDAEAGMLMAVAVVEGRGVAVCASVITSEWVHCAGVETLPPYRGCGLGAQAVAGWARLVRNRGAIPFYGTTFDNIHSQRLADRLRLRLIGGEFTVA